MYIQQNFNLLLLQVALHFIVRTVSILMCSMKLLMVCVCVCVCVRALCSVLLNVFCVTTDIKIAFFAQGY